MVSAVEVFGRAVVLVRVSVREEASLDQEEQLLVRLARIYSLNGSYHQLISRPSSLSEHLYSFLPPTPQTSSMQAVPQAIFKRGATSPAHPVVSRDFWGSSPPNLDHWSLGASHPDPCPGGREASRPGLVCEKYKVDCVGPPRGADSCFNLGSGRRQIERIRRDH